MPRTPTLDIHALVKRTGIDPRTIRRYAERGLIPRPEFASKKTRYTHEHVVRLLAIRKLYQTTSRLSVIEAEMAKRSFAELEALVGLAAPTATPEKPAAPPTPVPAATSSAPLAPRPSKAERWWRVTLLSGLELAVRDDATPIVRRIAQEIEERYCSTPAKSSG